MSKHIAVITRADITRAALVESGGRSMAQVKASTGCDYIINSWFYNMTTSKPTGNLKISGTVKASAGWNAYGLTWDAGSDIRMDLIPDRGGDSYLSGVELLTPGKGPGAALNYDPAYGGTRGRSAVLLAGDNLILYCSGDGTEDGATPEWLRDELVEIGKAYASPETLRALGLDSGGSSQCDFDGVGKIYSSRRVAGYLCVWTDSQDKEDDIMGKTVCLDPGHWPGSVNCAPDKSYWEYEFTWDLYTRLRPLLEKQGFTVVGTRTEHENPSLTARATVSNKAGADLFISLHSNAVSGGWGSARGFVAYTSSGPDTAERNKAAVAIINAVHAAGITLFGTGKPYHELFTVLTATTAPAVLLECGFHTNKEEVALLKTADYRDKLSKAIASGVMNYFGVEEQQPESGQPDQADPWAQEAWDKAVAAGIFDGTRPRDPLTRQEAAVVLDRLNLL